MRELIVGFGLGIALMLSIGRAAIIAGTCHVAPLILPPGAC